MKRRVCVSEFTRLLSDVLEFHSAACWLGFYEVNSGSHEWVFYIREVGHWLNEYATVKWDDLDVVFGPQNASKIRFARSSDRPSYVLDYLYGWTVRIRPDIEFRYDGIERRVVASVQESWFSRRSPLPPFPALQNVPRYESTNQTPNPAAFENITFNFDDSHFDREWMSRADSTPRNNGTVRLPGDSA
jgi:hypothetical protein